MSSMTPEGDLGIASDYESELVHTTRYPIEPNYKVTPASNICPSRVPQSLNAYAAAVFIRTPTESVAYSGPIHIYTYFLRRTTRQSHNLVYNSSYDLVHLRCPDIKTHRKKIKHA
jgi:hypothetical protein